MDIQTYPEWALPASLEADIAALLAQSFDTDFGGGSFFLQRHHMRFVAQDGNALLGHKAMCYRNVQLGPDSLAIWGLADVATAPAARGRGVATQLLQTALDFARTTHAAYVLLFGDRPLYAAAGFEPQTNPLTYLAIEDAQTVQVATEPAQDLMVLPLSTQTWRGTAPLDLLGAKF